jgi:AGCS family alanine or glycine:cation symporter
MYYLQAAFKTKFFAYAATILLCFYGIETLQFLILVDRIEHSFELDRTLIIGALLVLVLYTTLGGINRLANVCTILMPVFMVIYIGCSLYIIGSNATHLPDFFYLVLSTAFTGHAAIGGFAGSTMLLGVYLGMSRTVYSGDIGIGYDSIVQSETRIVNPRQQATLAIYALFTDTVICLLTNTMLGVSGAWNTLNHLNPSDIVASVLSEYFPYSDLFMTILMFFAGFTTIIAYLAAGTKCARFLYPKYGKRIYLLFSIFSFIFFCNFSQEKVMILMSMTGGLLVLLNLAGIFKLRKEIEF